MRQDKRRDQERSDSESACVYACVRAEEERVRDDGGEDQTKNEQNNKNI
jgi:hypothetical protein